MKLRNKKTGEIVTLDSNHDDSLADFGGKILVETKGKEFSYHTLAELCENWEDYKPAKPLIKDEKIRKAVRAWAEATGTTSVCYWGGELESEQNDSKIEFDDIAVVEFGDNYTIAELCGEEE